MDMHMKNTLLAPIPSNLFYVYDEYNKIKSWKFFLWFNFFYLTIILYIMTMEQSFLMWVVPHEGMPMFRKYTIGDMPLFDEYVIISSSLAVYFNINKNSANANLQHFGHVLQNIPGDAIITAYNMETGEPMDVSQTIESELHNILQIDTKQRLDYFSQLYDDKAITN